MIDLPVGLPLLLALLLDAAFGEPAWLYRRIPHPVVMLGHLISAAERRLLRPEASPARKRIAGVLLLVLVTGIAVAVGLALHLVLARLPAGWAIEAALMSTLIAQRSLVDHVRAVADGLDQGLAEARAAVSRIVGRDPEALDRPAIARAALESLAENFSDGVVAPLFWGLVGGLPGMLAYKAVNTLDSMVGHKSPRYLDFGRASARFDDLVNLIPARLAALVLLLAAFVSRLDVAGAWRAIWRDAKHHRSPNAGWPEAAMAGALDLRLAGPRSYGGVQVDDGWMGDGSPDADVASIRAGLRLAWVAWGVLFVLTALTALG
ncbi:MAG: adenosylcobinamide-phosphate synthase CbiB [Geminicoccaceae bacterium]